MDETAQPNVLSRTAVILLLLASTSAPVLARTRRKSPQARRVVAVRAERPSTRPAASERPAWSVAPRIGVVDPASKLGLGFALGIGGRWVPPRSLLPALHEHFGLGLDLSFSQSSVQGTATDNRVLPPQGPTYTWSLRSVVVPVLLDLLYVDNLDTRLAPLNFYAGVGVGWTSVKTVASALQSQVVESGGTFTAEPMVGLGVKVGPGDLFGELRYGLTYVHYLATGSANVSGLSFGAGYRIYF